MLKWTVFAIFLHLISLIDCGTRPQPKGQIKVNTNKQVVFTNIGQCSDKPNLPMEIHPMSIIREGRNNYYVSGNITLHRDFDNGFYLKFRIEKCDEAVNPDSCSMIISEADTIPTNICDFIRMPLKSFVYALNKTEPRLQCPLKRHTFTISRIAVSDNFLTLESDSNSNFWKIVVVGIGVADGKDVMCLSMDFYTRLKRRRENKRNNNNQTVSTSN